VNAHFGCLSSYPHLAEKTNLRQVLDGNFLSGMIDGRHEVLIPAGDTG
jgi:hypothetical protein